MFTVNDARAVLVNLKQRINSVLNNEQMVFYQNGFTRTSLSATITRVSNFVEESVLLLLHSQYPLSRCIQSLIQHVKYANRNALCMLKALNKCFK